MNLRLYRFNFRDQRRRHIFYGSVHARMLRLLGNYAYPSFWRYKFFGPKHDVDKSLFYLTARPHPGAGIGHQLANWIAGLWFAGKFGCKFAHLPFYRGRWEQFLGFGEKGETVKDLLKRGWRMRRIPLFKEGSSGETFVQEIMSCYSGEKVIFLCEQDQFYRNQYGVVEELKDRFFHASAREGEKLEYNRDHLNIAIHVRRGDIMLDLSNPNLRMRYLSNDYFYKVLEQVVRFFSDRQPKPIHIWFFSQGVPSDYPEFSSFPNMHWCLDMKAAESFLHMVCADVLITSKSSFSYKPALLNSGVKVCPRDFWHGYPDADDWVMVSNEGEVDFSRLERLYPSKVQ